MSWHISLISFSANELGAKDPVKDSREGLWGIVESQGGGRTIVWTERCLILIITLNYTGTIGLNGHILAKSYYLRSF